MCGEIVAADVQGQSPFSGALAFGLARFLPSIQVMRDQLSRQSSLQSRVAIKGAPQIIAFRF